MSLTRTGAIGRRDTPIGVGIIGAGSVTRGIHLPVLAALGDQFAVRHVVDVDEKATAEVAARVGARGSTTMAAMLQDDDVEVIAVCTPHEFHAEHVIAACHAGVKVILCEKPFATSVDEAKRLGRAVSGSGTHVVVGSMHRYDPAWVFAAEHWGELPSAATIVRSSIVLPFNARFERWATEPDVSRTFPPRDTSTPEGRADVLAGGFLSLAIHDIPLVRMFLPEWRELRIVSADPVKPLGYAVTIEAGGRIAQFIGSMRDYWLPEWQFEVISAEVALRLDFTPSYVRAGSGVATLSMGSEVRAYRAGAENGYEREWRHIASLARDPSVEPVPVQDLVDDVAFAVRLAELSAAFVLERGV